MTEKKKKKGNTQSNFLLIQLGFTRDSDGDACTIW